MKNLKEKQWRKLMRYLHIKPISIDDDEFEDFKRIGFHDWIFEQAELRNLTYDYVEQTKPVTRYSRAKRNGTLLLCPDCKSTKGNRVYHFGWCTILCQNCKAEVKKYDWRIADE